MAELKVGDLVYVECGPPPVLLGSGGIIKLTHKFKNGNFRYKILTGALFTQPRTFKPKVMNWQPARMLDCGEFISFFDGVAAVNFIKDCDRNGYVRPAEYAYLYHTRERQVAVWYEDRFDWKDRGVMVAHFKTKEEALDYVVAHQKHTYYSKFRER